MMTHSRQWYWRALLVLVAGLLISCGPQASTLPDFTELAERNQASVVNISTVQKASRQEDVRQQIPEFFRHFFDGLEDHFTIPERDRESQGSGFVIEKDGYILTNYHVVHGADEIMVRLQDRRELSAELVGADKQSDLALLKVDANDLVPVNIGSSEDLKVGEWVLAIGAPFGFESTVTAGIVSAVGRSLPNENYVPFIQTDVAINPGNSGGPLINLKGEVVGINSQIISRSGGFMGLSFAIPVDMAMDVVKQLKETGMVKRGWLGVMIQGIDRDLAASFGLDKATGALVANVMADAPGEKAGLKAGDIILRVDGKEVQRSSQLPQMIGRLAPGTKTKLEVMRDGKKRTLTVTVGAAPGEDEVTTTATESKEEGATLGLVVEPLDKATKEKLGLDHGVRVKEAKPGVARKAGVRAGDIVRSLNNQEITSPEQFASLAKELPKDTWVPLLVQRGENPMFLAIKVEK